MEPFNKQDIVHLENLIKALRKAKFELEGLEVLALSDVFKWVSNLHQKIAEDIKAKETPLANAIVEPKAKLEVSKISKRNKREQ